jgi:hypothetical protein
MRRLCHSLPSNQPKTECISEKGLITEQEYFAKVKQVQVEYKGKKAR